MLKFIPVGGVAMSDTNLTAVLYEKEDIRLVRIQIYLETFKRSFDGQNICCKNSFRQAMIEVKGNS